MVIATGFRIHTEYHIPKAFLDMDRFPLVTADEYLSGNVRRKLREARRAAEDDPAYQPNVTALTAALPKDLEASEILRRLRRWAEG